MFRRGLRIVLVALAIAGCARPIPAPAPAAANETVTIFVAASTKETVERIARDFKTLTTITVEVTPGPSPGLVKQIEQGAKADLFLSADQPWADHLATKDLIQKRRTLLRNSLVVVVPTDSPVQLSRLQDLTDARIKRLALAEEKVPAGAYAREALKGVAIWDEVKDRVVGGTDVRVTLQLVEKGADAGLVYRTDAIGSTQVRVALEVDPKLHKPIEYPLVLLRRTAGIKPSAERFFGYLHSDQAGAVFREARFEMAP